MRKMMVGAVALALVLSMALCAAACGDEAEGVVFAKAYDRAQLADTEFDRHACDKTLQGDEGDFAMICESAEEYENLREDLSKAVEMKRYGDAFFEQNSIAVLFGLCSGAGDLDAKYSIVGDALTVELNGSDELRQRQYCVVLELPKQESSAVKTLSVAKNAPQALAELKTSARQDRLEKFVLPEHADATIEDVTLAPFLGVFDGAVAAVFYCGQYHGVWPDVLEETTIGDVTFSLPAGYPIEVWKDGEICELSEAYEKDIITDDDLKEIFGNYTLL